MLIKKAEREGEEVCVQSQCNYVSLFFEVGAEQGKVVSSLDYTYSYALDHSKFFPPTFDFSPVFILSFFDYCRMSTMQ